MNAPTAPVDEQAAKAASIALLQEIRTAWSSFSPGWTEPGTLIYRSGSDPCQIVTSTNLGGRWVDGPSAETLIPSLNTVLAKHGYPEVPTVEYLNGQALLRSVHKDGRAVEFRGRSGSLEVYVPAPASQCDVSPRRI